MYQIAGAAQMKELDRQAIEEYGVSSLGLMERAAQAVAEEVRGLLEGGGPDFIGGADSVTAGTAWPPPASSGAWAFGSEPSWWETGGR